MNLGGPYERSRGEIWSVRLLQLVSLFWLAGLASPVSLLLGSHPAGLRLAAALAGSIGFVGVYLWTLLDNPLTRGSSWRPQERWGRRLLPLSMLAALATVMSISIGPAWLVLFIFVAVGSAFRLPPAQLAWLIGALILVDGVIGLSEQQSLTQVVQFALLVGGNGAGIAVLGYSIRTTRGLRAARAEAGGFRLAVWLPLAGRPAAGPGTGSDSAVA